MLVNFRDIGGIIGEYGSLKKGFFYRSGQLTDLTLDDKCQLRKDINLRKVYDLRGETEIVSQPDTVISNIEYENLDILSSVTSGKSASLQDMIKHADDINQAMLDTYEQLVISESSRFNYHYFIMDIIRNKQPILFHCFAGKDRTGYAAMLLLKIAGIDEQLIMNDYLLTNKYREHENEKIIQSLSSEYSPKQLKALNTALLVDESYLTHAYSVIKREYNTFDNYLFEGLNISDKDIESFRKKYII